MLKLKLKKSSADAAPEEAAATSPGDGPAPPKKPSLKLKFASTPSISTDAPPAAEPPKQKRKYVRKPKTDEHGNPLPAASKGPKKRQREDGEDGSPAAKRKPKPSLKIVEGLAQEADDAAPAEPVRPQPQHRPSIKINLGAARKDRGSLVSAGGGRIALKAKGRPPPRPPGVGYDSEAEEAETDPAIESQFVLRMLPTEDCELLRKAIQERTIGKPAAEHGLRLEFKFFDKEGRRAMVAVGQHRFAATMVDLPCIVESMKSWNKKDWVKTADVCQMLLVLGRVEDEHKAKTFPLPREVEQSTHLYPHGLTPPMQWARKRRFRKRTSYRRIEEVESQVNELLEADERVAATGGVSEYQVIDQNQLESEEEETEEDDEHEGMDMSFAGGMDTPAETPAEMEVEVENDDLERMMMEEFGENGDLFNEGGEVELEIETPATSHDVAMHHLGDTAIPTTETPGSTSQVETPSAGDDDDDDDDDDDEDDDEEMDEEQQRQRQEQDQQREEVRILEKELESVIAQQASHTNVMFRRRLDQRIEALRNDIKIKKIALGEDEDD